MRSPLTLAVLAAALSVPAHAGPRVADAAGGFSYTAPNGWRAGSLPGSQYKVCYAKPVGGFAPNVNVVEENAPVSVSAYAPAALAPLQARMPGFRLISQSPFVTRAGLRGVRVVAEDAPAGRKLRQIFYLFPGRGARKVVTASLPAAVAGQYVGAVDAAMKTFTVR